MSESLDGDLETSMQEAFGEHLRMCPACRNQVHTMQTLGKMLANLKPIRPSSHFHFALRTRLIEELARRRPLQIGFHPWVSYRRPILVAASFALLVLFSIRLSRHNLTEERAHSDRIVTHYVLERISPSDRNASISLDSDSNVHFTEPETLSVPVQTVSGRIRMVSF
jgi:anti-sigma factor RsiW